jgi:hypothetical protein
VAIRKFPDALPPCCQSHYRDLNNIYPFKLNINNSKANVKSKWDEDSFSHKDSIVIPHIIPVEMVGKMHSAAMALGFDPEVTVGGGVSELKVLDKPSSRGTLPEEKQNFIDEFILPFLQKMGIPADELLQVFTQYLTI